MKNPDSVSMTDLLKNLPVLPERLPERPEGLASPIVTVRLKWMVGDPSRVYLQGNADDRSVRLVAGPDLATNRTTWGVFLTTEGHQVLIFMSTWPTPLLLRGLAEGVSLVPNSSQVPPGARWIINTPTSTDYSIMSPIPIPPSGNSFLGVGGPFVDTPVLVPRETRWRWEFSH